MIFWKNKDHRVIESIFKKKRKHITSHVKFSLTTETKSFLFATTRPSFFTLSVSQMLTDDMKPLLFVTGSSVQLFAISHVHGCPFHVSEMFALGLLCLGWAPYTEQTGKAEFRKPGYLTVPSVCMLTDYSDAAPCRPCIRLMMQQGTSSSTGFPLSWAETFKSLLELNRWTKAILQFQCIWVLPAFFKGIDENDHFWQWPFMNTFVSFVSQQCY